MVSCSGSLVQSCCGEGRCCRQTSLCVGSAPRVPATLVCPAQGCLCFPVYTAQAPGCCAWNGPCVACSSSFQVPHKSADSAGPAFCAFPVQAAPAARSLMGGLLPSAGPASASALWSGAPCVCSGGLASSLDPCGCRPSRISGSLWLETGSLLAVW